MARGDTWRKEGAGPSSYRRNDKQRDDGNAASQKRRPKKRSSTQREEGEEDDEPEPDDGIGVNKIKAAIRQTKRLLAKEKLSALSRQEAERRHAALEDELLRRMSAQHERKNAQRYHKVKFFERQKLMRRIAKAKRQLQDDKLDDQHRVRLEDELRNSRILLNYVLHFPMAQKYVALFPNNGPSPLDQASTSESEEISSSRKRMEAVRAQIVEAMEKGTISAEPDIELESRATDLANPQAAKRTKLSTGTEHRQNRSKQQGVSDAANKAAKSDLQDDDFFA